MDLSNNTLTVDFNCVDNDYDREVVSETVDHVLRVLDENLELQMGVLKDCGYGCCCCDDDCCDEEWDEDDEPYCDRYSMGGNYTYSGLHDDKECAFGDYEIDEDDGDADYREDD